MIGRLTGRLVEKQPPHLLIDVQGVGYELLAPMTTFYQLPGLGESLSLYTHLSISEAAHQLFGFASSADRSFFRLLIKVTGVGPKMALAILSAMDAQECAQCLLQNNLIALVRIPGVGKKTAERLVIEMRDRLKDWAPQASASPQAAQDLPAAQVLNAMVAEAESALVALGYKPAEAAKAIAAAMKQQELTRTEDVIRAVLRAMSPT
ncbi:MAG TPA: Holliday junction branch migration protein RuvA [Cellvibrionaceae bacterium]|nr:Holliday junction branch migration protein RuvA [Cellvibrionaceae bacterium]HMW47809.1 Holliday junction branch migration protein RuvA [Cellvibrionaceae bacterium]HMY37680.1 Holliday junction branch migration protein RuvA [Marinagarivorans sp.]HNG61749.1 Holliday junction branch migration protein RuvA [Cellvibrionaceae bacterium]